MAKPSANLKNPFDKGEGEAPDADSGEGGEAGGVVVPLRGADDDDDDDEGEPDAHTSAREGAPERETSRDRRRNRYKEQKEGREKAERERDDYRARIAALEAGYARQAAPAPQGPGLDERYKQIKDDVYEKRRQLSKQYTDLVNKGALTEDLEKMLWEKQRELNTNETRTDMEYARLSNPANHPGHQEQNAERQAVINWLKMEHGDVLQHQSGQAILMYAQAEEVRLIQNGAPRDLNTTRRSLDAAKLHFGLTKRPAPSSSARRAYSGGSSSAGVGGGSPNGGAPTSLTLTKAQQEMAEARYPTLKPADAFKKWANRAGRKMLENRRSER